MGRSLISSYSSVLKVEVTMKQYGHFALIGFMSALPVFLCGCADPSEQKREIEAALSESAVHATNYQNGVFYISASDQEATGKTLSVFVAKHPECTVTAAIYEFNGYFVICTPKNRQADSN
jgi:hypothetical protein